MVAVTGLDLRLKGQIFADRFCSPVCDTQNLRTCAFSSILSTAALRSGRFNCHWRCCFVVNQNAKGAKKAISKRTSPFHAYRMPTGKASQDRKVRANRSGMVCIFAVKSHQVLGIKRKVIPVGMTFLSGKLHRFKCCSVFLNIFSDPHIDFEGNAHRISNKQSVAPHIGNMSTSCARVKYRNVLMTFLLILQLYSHHPLFL